MCTEWWEDSTVSSRKIVSGNGSLFCLATLHNIELRVLHDQTKIITS